MRFTLLVLFAGLSCYCDQIDYQPQIDNYQNLFACSYLAKYQLDNMANKTFTEAEFPNKERLKLFYKMVTYCRGKITLETSAQLIQSGFDYDDKFASTMLDTVRQLTNYGTFIRNKNALTLTATDKETVDLLFEISKNEGERHGKMPTFGRTGKQPQQSVVVPPPDEQETQTIQEEVAQRKPAATKYREEEDSIKKVETIKEQEQVNTNNEIEDAAVISQIDFSSIQSVILQYSNLYTKSDFDYLDNFMITIISDIEEVQEEVVEEKPIVVKPTKKAETPKKVPKKVQQPIEDEDLEEEEEDNQIPAKRKGKKLRQERTIDTVLSQHLDAKSLIIIFGVILFILYQRQQNQHIQMLLRMKELEFQAQQAKAEAARVGDGESKKKK